MIRFKATTIPEPSDDHGFQQDEEPCFRCSRPVRFAIPHGVVELVATATDSYCVHPETEEEREEIRSYPGYAGFESVCVECTEVVGAPYVKHGVMTPMGFEASPSAMG